MLSFVTPLVTYIDKGGNPHGRSCPDTEKGLFRREIPTVDTDYRGPKSHRVDNTRLRVPKSLYALGRYIPIKESNPHFRKENQICQ